MFCYQCQEALNNKGCTIRGVCGKPSDTANLQYAAIFVCKQIAFWNKLARSLKIDTTQGSHYIIQVLFATITNANFDDAWFSSQIKQGFELRRKLKAEIEEKSSNGSEPKLNLKDIPEWAEWETEVTNSDITALVLKGKMEDPLSVKDVDLRSLKDLAVIGLKGLAAYLEHAMVLGFEKDEIYQFLEQILIDTQNSSLTVEDWIGLVMKVGEFGVKGMALLDEANTTTYGHPEPTAVNLGVKEGPAILVSGHDLRDLHELLEQTKDKGINIYTHGEMLPAHAYPKLKKYPHLVGNYGGSWWHQTKEFESFKGAILMTTNCLVPPKKSYKDRIFVTGAVGFTGIPRIPDRVDDKPKDFSMLIKRALELPGPTQLEEGTVMTGFAHESILGVADKIVEAIKSGALRRFIVMAGCDGRMKSRQYYTDVAKNLPNDTIILTAGCAKYRYNKLDLGDIDGIPRVIDAGQCNDSYSLAVVALKLAEIFETDSINDLPISFDIAWYEQKAVIVLLALLYLGVKNIRLGPTLPAFLSENVIKVLVEKFNIMPINSVQGDIADMLAGK
ncbi:MAG: hydroxylamine reductase [Candidatus Lokiarchaeota archaeon]|nr:hydroxylamine reductase [Candidatus Harpocratesius repetitus]